MCLHTSGDSVQSGGQALCVPLQRHLVGRCRCTRPRTSLLPAALTNQRLLELTSIVCLVEASMCATSFCEQVHLEHQIK